MKLPALLKNEKGFMMFLAVVLCLVTATMFAIILPQLHMGQQIAAITNLNEYRAYSAAKKGVDTVKLGVKYTTGAGDSFQNLIDTSTSDVIDYGIIDAIYDVLGDPTSPSDSAKHNEYWGQDPAETIPLFVSNCLHINESIAGVLEHEKGKLDIAILVKRGDSNDDIVDRGDGPGDPDPFNDPKNDEIYFWDGTEWISYDHPTFTDWDKFAYRDSNNVWYCDFDLDISPGGGDADVKADFAFKYIGEKWSVTIGNNGSFRDKDGTTQLWDFELTISDANEPYQGMNNDGISSADCPGDDCIEVFIIVRSTGITVTPEDTYDSAGSQNLVDLQLVNNANSHLPNPMRQVIEAGFYLYDDSGQVNRKQFHFRKIHNLKADDVP